MEQAEGEGTGRGGRISGGKAKGQAKRRHWRCGPDDKKSSEMTIEKNALKDEIRSEMYMMSATADVHTLPQIICISIWKLFYVLLVLLAELEYVAEKEKEKSHGEHYIPRQATRTEKSNTTEKLPSTTRRSYYCYGTLLGEYICSHPLHQGLHECGEVDASDTVISSSGCDAPDRRHGSLLGLLPGGMETPRLAHLTLIGNERVLLLSLLFVSFLFHFVLYLSLFTSSASLVLLPHQRSLVIRPGLRYRALVASGLSTAKSSSFYLDLACVSCSYYWLPTFTAFYSFFIFYYIFFFFLLVPPPSYSGLIAITLNFFFLVCPFTKKTELATITLFLWHALVFIWPNSWLLYGMYSAPTFLLLLREREEMNYRETVVNHRKARFGALKISILFQCVQSFTPPPSLLVTEVVYVARDYFLVVCFISLHTGVSVHTSGGLNPSFEMQKVSKSVVRTAYFGCLAVGINLVV
eukprot:gene2039-1229_t